MLGRLLKTACSRLLASVSDGVVTTIRTVAFWTAILLPILYVPLVVFDHSTVADLWFLGKLVTLNVAAVVVGHGHGGFDDTE
jgi:hypothetical protein